MRFSKKEWLMLIGAIIGLRMLTGSWLIGVIWIIIAAHIVSKKKEEDS